MDKFHGRATVLTTTSLSHAAIREKKVASFDLTTAEITCSEGFVCKARKISMAAMSDGETSCNKLIG